MHTSYNLLPKEVTVSLEQIWMDPQPKKEEAGGWMDTNYSSLTNSEET